jgi:hypothetical protein
VTPSDSDRLLADLIAEHRARRVDATIRLRLDALSDDELDDLLARFGAEADRLRLGPWRDAPTAGELAGRGGYVFHCGSPGGRP